MAIIDIVGQSGDAQDFILEIPAGNAGYVPDDALIEDDGSLLCVEIPEVTGGGGNIFVISD